MFRLLYIKDQAHRFAAAFLPARTFANDFYTPNLDAFRALKPKWKVSIGMMVYRSGELELVSKEQERRLWINRTRRGWRTKEPLDDQIPVEEPRLLRRAFHLSIDEGVQSRAEIAAALPYALRDIEELAGLPPHFLEEKPAPISLKAFKSKRFRNSREEPTEPAEVMDFSTTGDGKSG
jgi:hypothetical protein